MGEVGVSGSHQVRANRVHQVSADSDFMSVPSLWQLAKASDYREASHSPPQVLKLSRFVLEVLQLG